MTFVWQELFLVEKALIWLKYISFYCQSFLFTIHYTPFWKMGWECIFLWFNVSCAQRKILHLPVILESRTTWKWQEECDQINDFTLRQVLFVTCLSNSIAMLLETWWSIFLFILAHREISRFFRTWLFAWPAWFNTKVEEKRKVHGLFMHNKLKRLKKLRNV